MARGRTGAYVLSFLLPCFAFAGSEKCPADPPTDSQNIQTCGVYALYSYFRCTKRDVAYQEVFKVLSPTSRGNSLLELRDAARQLGLDLEICKTSPEDRSIMRQGPFIAHMRKERVTKDRFTEPTYFACGVHPRN